jgi:hypothetical protein
MPVDGRHYKGPLAWCYIHYCENKNGVPRMLKRCRNAVLEDYAIELSAAAFVAYGETKKMKEVEAITWKHAKGFATKVSVVASGLTCIVGAMKKP